LISARLHGIILGLRFGLPFIGIDSDGKVMRVASSIGYDNLVIKDLDFNRNLFFNLVEHILNQRLELRQDLLQKGELMRNRAKKNRLILEQCLLSFKK